MWRARRLMLLLATVGALAACAGPVPTASAPVSAPSTAPDPSVAHSPPLADRPYRSCAGRDRRADRARRPLRPDRVRRFRGRLRHGRRWVRCRQGRRRTGVGVRRRLVTRWQVGRLPGLDARHQRQRRDLRGRGRRLGAAEHHQRPGQRLGPGLVARRIHHRLQLGPRRRPAPRVPRRSRWLEPPPARHRRLGRIPVVLARRHEDRVRGPRRERLRGLRRRHRHGRDAAADRQPRRRRLAGRGRPTGRRSPSPRSATTARSCPRPRSAGKPASPTTSIATSGSSTRTAPTYAASPPRRASSLRGHPTAATSWSRVVPCTWSGRTGRAGWSCAPTASTVRSVASRTGAEPRNPRQGSRRIP